MNKSISINMFVVIAVFSFLGAAAIQSLYMLGALAVSGMADVIIVGALAIFGIANLIFLKKRDNQAVRTIYKVLVGLLGIAGLYFIGMVLAGLNSI